MLKLIKKIDEIELIRDECNNIRDLAMIDFLNSSGVRVSELCNLNIRDIDMDKKEGIVYSNDNAGEEA